LLSFASLVGRAAALGGALCLAAAVDAQAQDHPAGPTAHSSELARLVQRQPALLQSEATMLAPHRQGQTDIYAIGMAGWATLDVFAKEVDGGLTAVGRVLPIKDRTIRLINHPATAAYVPLATLHNFQAAVHDVGKVMDKENDVLVLFMTSHGDRNGVALQLPNQIVDLTPQDVAAAFRREGIKNRVVIVSACFSGIFVPPLQNANTIVMTAADATHTSFGCAPEREWTYFGDAFFRQALQPGTDFQSAFHHARILIEGWELMDRATPSNPQGFFGSALVAKLAPIFRSAQAADQ
jgi:hypothetical protein